LSFEEVAWTDFVSAAAMVAALAREVLWMKVRLDRLSLLMIFLFSFS
jgi:hypothetical protein